jgi:type IV pilus assembly protein PilA
MIDRALLGALLAIIAIQKTPQKAPPPVASAKSNPYIYAQRSYQSEAIANLKAMYAAEKAYFQEKDKYSTLKDDVGFEPERFNRYRYVLRGFPITIEVRSGAVATKHPTDEGISEDMFKYPPLTGVVSQGPCIGSGPVGVNGITFTGMAIGNIPGHSTADIWTVSTAGRQLSGPNCDAPGYAPAGLPVNEHNALLH